MDFIMGEKLKILISHFWPEKCTNTGLEYTKRCGIATFGGYVFWKKYILSIFSWEYHDFRFLRSMESHYNPKNLKSWLSNKNMDKIYFFQKKYPPKCCYSASFLVYSRPVLVHFSDQKWDFKIINFPPIVKSMFSLYNLLKYGGKWISLPKF